MSVEKDVEKKIKKETIWDVVRSGDLEGLKASIESGDDINGIEPETGFTPMHLACEKEYYLLILALITHGANTELTTSAEQVVGERFYEAGEYDLLGLGMEELGFYDEHYYS